MSTKHTKCNIIYLYLYHLKAIKVMKNNELSKKQEIDSTNTNLNYEQFKKSCTVNR
jgi:hypothetical protein